jgi:hypothetical protein
VLALFFVPFKKKETKRLFGVGSEGRSRKDFLFPFLSWFLFFFLSFFLFDLLSLFWGIFRVAVNEPFYGLRNMNDPF